ncbi:putative translation initiation factor [Gonapodya prolifera JEL478]|uniref:Methylthioribose-1-phosphate isomerase n=1 Tax=Gonapodya prolifera (strain JEL478) TaxID=1344416 RepID=A0A139AUT0_GONPJ|nr:putative translation initiation factor [Gonapodya prolifera JEL478]|eukprot:KXS20496.1 putative translation initiation factor [Gonapodya prolifera JEL478]
MPDSNPAPTPAPSTPTAPPQSTLEAIKYRPGRLEILNQLLLPWESVYEDVDDSVAGHAVIKTMKVRGAPAIAIVGALSLAVEITSCYFSSPPTPLAHTTLPAPPSLATLTPALAAEHVTSRLAYLKTSRPTAVNLTDAASKLTALVHSIAASHPSGGSQEGLAVLKAYVDAAEKMMADDVADNRAIGKFGADFVLRSAGERKVGDVRVLTHCNTGSLATAGWGTALGIIRDLQASGKLVRAYCTETRPYNQGSRLTAYELVHEGIPATLITDSMASHLMRTQPLSAVIVGADRVTVNGDTANKIGTYQLAIAAKFHGVPFIVAAPSTSIDLALPKGDGIVIEERSGVEVVTIRGKVVDDEAAVKEPRAPLRVEDIAGRRSGSRTLAAPTGAGSSDVDADGDGEGEASEVEDKPDADADEDETPLEASMGGQSVMERLGARVDQVVEEIEAAVFGVEQDEDEDEEGDGQSGEEGDVDGVKETPSGSGSTVVGNGHVGGGSEDDGTDEVMTCLIRIAAEGVGVWNPAFDVTPASLVTAIVTEKGVAVKKEGSDVFDLKTFLAEHK